MKQARITINGFGRIGRIFFRQAFDDGRFEIVAINDLGQLENLAYLLRYDSVYRAYPGDVSATKRDGKQFLIVDGKEIVVLQEKDPSKLPWKDMNIDIAIEATGFFSDFEKAKFHLNAGAKRVVITAPAHDGEQDDKKTILMGVNENQMKKCTVTSNGSCTTNATSPIVAVMAENPGIAKAMLTTVHGYTATQSLTDTPSRGKDFRKGRAAAQNIIPSSTGAAISVARAIPEIRGKFDGVAIRVPTIVGSLVDFTFLARKKTSVDEVNEIFKAASKDERWSNVLSIVDDDIVSSDIIGAPYGAIVDVRFTQVVDGDLVKVFSWYDNEWGYVSTLVQHVLKMAETL